VNAATASNRTALFYACSKNNATMASLLLKAGANRTYLIDCFACVSSASTPAATIKGVDGSAPIHRAASGGAPEVRANLLVYCKLTKKNIAPVDDFAA
jgi:ankyrin repeat protein